MWSCPCFSLSANIKTGHELNIDQVLHVDPHELFQFLDK